MKLSGKLAALFLAFSLATTANAFTISDLFGKSDDTAESSPENIPETEDFTPKRGNRSPLPDKKPEIKHKERRDKKLSENKTETEENAQTTAAVQNWYCKHTTDSTRPPIPPEMSFVEDWGGYFLGQDEKVIYLTFDAGYENGNIEKILDVLKEEDVPGAFFVLENLVTRNTDLVKRMVEEGHTVCNHTASHKDMTKITSKEDFAAELSKMAEIYKSATGYDMAMYYRPPEGKFNEDNMKWANELGYKTIFWSFAYADWDNDHQMSTGKAKEKILSGTHNGEIILLHPTSATNAAILSDLIKEWKEMGYRFGTLDELTGA